MRRLIETRSAGPAAFARDRAIARPTASETVKDIGALRSVLFATAALAGFAPAALAQAPAPAPAQAPAPVPAPARPATPSSVPAEQSPTVVEGVTVTGQRDAMRSSIDRRSYSVAGDLRAQTGSVADALRNLPSVEVDLQGNVSVRGDANVTILIDGKPSGLLRGEGRGDALQSLPADQIERVELMTNPSAAFSPEGGAVINLISKKNRRPGGYVTLRGAAGTGERANGSINAVRTRGKVTLSGDLSVRRDGVEATSVNERARLTGGRLAESRQQGRNENESLGINVRGAIDYDPDPQNRLSAEVRYSDLQIDSESSQAFELDDPNGTVARAFERTAETELDRWQSVAVASWTRKFTGEQHEIETNFLFDRTDVTRRQDGVVDASLPGPGVSYEDILTGIVQDLARLEIEYDRPMGESSRLKAGYVLELADNRYDSLGRRGSDLAALPVDPNLTNLFEHQLSVHSVFSTYERPFGDKLTIQGGLRAEQVKVETNLVTTGEVNTQDYFKIYPSLHLGYELSEQQELSASYSLRSQRPNEDFLNPFVTFIDPFNLRAGNPRLQPNETHSFEAGWRYRRQKTYYLATVYFRDSSNGITEVTRDLGEGVFLTTFENLGERRAGGLELVANGPLGAKATYNVSGNAFREEIEASNLGFGEARSGTSVSLRGSLNWTPTPEDTFQVQGVINGRRLLPQGFVEPNGLLNLGYRRKVSDKLSLLVTAQNVLDSLERTVVIDTPVLRDRTQFRPRNRAVLVGFVYNFSQGASARRPEPGFEFDSGAAAAP